MSFVVLRSIDLRQEREHASHADQTLARLRRQIVAAAEADQDLLIVAAGRRIAVGAENLLRQRVDFAADLLQNVGRAIDDGLEQAHQDDIAARPQIDLTLGAIGEGVERLRLGVAHRHKPCRPPR